MARRLLVMAHWRLTPDVMKTLSHQDLEAMEFAFLVLERRQSETLDSLIGNMLGSSWDAAELMGRADEEKGKKNKKIGKKKEFTWAFRVNKPKVHLPLALALTQNPKFMDQLKKLASSALNSARENPSVVDAPTWVNSKKSEIVDLSYAPKEVFLQWAGRFK